MLGEKLKSNPDIRVWLINTGWSGGAYGVGSRMKLSYTRAMITAALEGELNHVQFENHPVFGLAMPNSCPNVPNELLNPRNTWSDKSEYDKKANHLAELFNKNFKQYAEGCSEEILSAAPKVSASAQ
jgi:phosphoenolpyruvate carboxykinase (ATP)